MAPFCGSCLKKRRATPEYWDYGDFAYLLDKLAWDEEERVLCDGCGWLTYKKFKYFSSFALRVIKREPITPKKK
jgi:hypothetical protein